jgi:hypothetical protein
MVEFDDGDRDSRVPRAHLRPQCVFPAPADVAAATRLEAFSRGVVVARRATRAAAARQRAAARGQAPAVREASRRRPEQQAAEVRTAAATAVQSVVRQRAAQADLRSRQRSANVAHFFASDGGVAARSAACEDLSYLVGADVEARYRGRLHWFRAVVTAATAVVVAVANASSVILDLLYADGDAEFGVPRFRVRQAGQTAPYRLEAGAAVDARKDAQRRKLYPAIVVNAWPDGEHYMVEFDDGDKFTKVRAQPHARAREKEHTAKLRSMHGHRFSYY